MAYAIETGTVEELLKKIYVRPGDFIYVPAGTVHAIGAGIRLVEVQQDSKTTYRLYDYGRKDSDGKERELHINEGLDCIKEHPEAGLRDLPFECPYFDIKELGNSLEVRTEDVILYIPLKKG